MQNKPIILSRPRRPVSGVDVLQSNFFESAVVKISGMTSEQLADFEDKVCVVFFFENEEVANAGLLDIRLLEQLSEHPGLTREMLLALAAHNQSEGGSTLETLQGLDRRAVFERMVETGLLKMALIISGQGPQAFGMPEMFTPMQHINANRKLRKLTALISDGRYSGVTYGAAIGHVTPEAFNGGGIGLLQTGDLLHLQLARRRIDLLDPKAFEGGRLVYADVHAEAWRKELASDRRARMLERQRRVAATNRLRDVTDAGRGVVPLAVAEGATTPWGGA